jgi:hypothetical protein
MIKYVKGDLFNYIDSNKRIMIPHVCNDLGLWGAGFVVPLGKKYPEAKKAYLDEFKLEYNKLGVTIMHQVGQNTYVANMIAQHKVGGERPLRYDSLCRCMNFVSEQCKIFNFEIYCPKFGSGLAGGNWRFIECLIQDFWVNQGIFVTVFEI